MFKWYKSPGTATAQKWHEWETWVKENHRIQYFFRHDVPMWFRVNVHGKLRNWKWSILHRFHPKYQYHIIRTDLTPGYYDPDLRILHGVFTLVEEYVKVRNLRGNGINGTRWTEEDLEYDKEYGMDAGLQRQIDFEASIITLADWWIARRDRPNPWDDVPSLEHKSIMYTMSDDFKQTEEGIEYYKALRNASEQERLWEEEDQQKLKEVIEILPSMWYP